MRPNVLLYFVKYPTPGKVKTRLAKMVGEQEAAKLYSELAEKNLKVIASLHQRNICDLVIVFDPPEKKEDFKRWFSISCEYWPQCRGGLSERLKHAFGEAFSAKGACPPDGRRGSASGGQKGGKRVMALGSDTLGLTTNIIQQGFEALHSNDVVVGPAEDGGYYLIGLSSLQPELFQDIPWSTDAVLQQTFSNISKLGLSYQTLIPLEDLDEIKIGERA